MTDVPSLVDAVAPVVRATGSRFVETCWTLALLEGMTLCGGNQKRLCSIIGASERQLSMHAKNNGLQDALGMVRSGGPGLLEGRNPYEILGVPLR